MNYVDGYVCAVPTANRDAYEKYSRTNAALFKEYGALSVVECWGDDVPEGKVTSFPMAVKCEANETVVFSWITWESKSARDEGWKKLMSDPRMSERTEPMPLDGKRMIYGGFQVLVAA
jgi:uncharacterized protein YbaA (DUF1428 family)